MDSSDSSVFYDSLFFVAAGVFLTFLYIPWTRWSIGFFHKNNPEMRAKLEKRMLSPLYIWLMRIVGVVALLFGGVGAWVTSGHSLPGMSS